MTHDNIPRFTNEDHERAIVRAKALCAKVPRENGLHIDFDQLYDQRDPVHCGITALPHFVLKKWHHGRIVVIGEYVTSHLSLSFILVSLSARKDLIVSSANTVSALRTNSTLCPARAA